MKVLEKALRKLEGRLLSIERNTVTGFYEMKVGLPKSWIFESNDVVEIDVLTETENGVLLLLKPTSEDVVIDDIIDYINVIIDTNEEVAKKEEEFEKKMEEFKKKLEDEAMSFYDELEEFKKTKFHKNDEDETKTTKKKPTSKTKKKNESKEVEEVADSDISPELMNKLKS